MAQKKEPIHVCIIASAQKCPIPAMSGGGGSFNGNNATGIECVWNGEGCCGQMMWVVLLWVWCDHL